MGEMLNEWGNPFSGLPRVLQRLLFLNVIVQMCILGLKKQLQNAVGRRIFVGRRNPRVGLSIK